LNIYFKTNTNFANFLTSNDKIYQVSSVLFDNTKKQETFFVPISNTNYCYISSNIWTTKNKNMRESNCVNNIPHNKKQIKYFCNIEIDKHNFISYIPYTIFQSEDNNENVFESVSESTPQNQMLLIVPEYYLTEFTINAKQFKNTLFLHIDNNIPIIPLCTIQKNNNELNHLQNINHNLNNNIQYYNIPFLPITSWKHFLSLLTIQNRDFLMNSNLIFTLCGKQSKHLKSYQPSEIVNTTPNIGNNLLKDYPIIDNEIRRQRKHNTIQKLVLVQNNNITLQSLRNKKRKQGNITLDSLRKRRKQKNSVSHNENNYIPNLNNTKQFKNCRNIKLFVKDCRLHNFLSDYVNQNHRWEPQSDKGARKEKLKLFLKNLEPEGMESFLFLALNNFWKGLQGVLVSINKKVIKTK